LAVVAAMTVVVGIIVAATSAYNKNAIAAKRAAEAAKEMAEAAKEAAQKVEDIKTAFDEYNEVRDILDDCVRGTTEWYEALDNVNSKVSELIKEYPELARFLTGRENGVLTFNVEGIESYINDLEGLASDANAMSLMANANAA
jgi:uncharacterized coiled-coil DUF342 family protein